MKKLFSIILLPPLFLMCVSCASTSLESNATYISDYHMTINYDDNTKIIDVLQSLNYRNNTQTVLDCLCFNLYPNAYRQNAIYKPIPLSAYDKAYPNGESFGFITIKNISVNGIISNIDIIGEDENILKVNFNDRLYPSDRILIKIEFSANIPNINHRFGYGNNAINLGNFYPIACKYENGDFITDTYTYFGDPFYSDMSNYDVEFICDNDFIIANTGEVVSQNKINSKTKYIIKALSVRDFAIVLSKKFQIIEGNIDKTIVKYYYYDDSDPNKSLKAGIDSLKTFNEIIGKYPYKVLSVVQTNFIHGGMEFPNLVYISDSLSSQNEYINVIVHEIAHQWWYNLVGNNQYENSWLDEGLTEHTTALFYMYNSDYDYTYDFIINASMSNYKLFINIYKGVYEELDTSMNRRLNNYKTEPEYVYTIYVKGSLMFDSIMKIIGEKKYIKSLKDYFNTYKFQIAKPEDLISSFQNTTNYDLENLFNSWIMGYILIY